MRREKAPMAFRNDLTPLVQLEKGIVPPPPPCYATEEAESFQWVLAPPGKITRGTFYTDGSRMFADLSRSTARLGWSFTVLDDAGNTVAEAKGFPPPWIIDIPGTEAWALLQAILHAAPGSHFRSDCLPCVNMLRMSRKEATAAHRPLARVAGLIFSAMVDVPRDHIVWMPAHTTIADVGRARLSNGCLLTAADRNANDRADALAKSAAMSRAPQEHELQAYRQYRQEVRATVQFIGKISVMANNMTEPPTRDSEANRRTKAGDRPRRVRKKPQQGPRPPTLGGHVLQTQTSAGSVTYQCAVCKRSSGKAATLAPGRCSGSAAIRWAQAAVAHAEQGHQIARGHMRALSGDLLWCVRCGSYATNVARGLTKACPGRWQGTGSEQHPRLHQLMALRRNLHPTLGTALPSPVLECDLHQAGDSERGRVLEELAAAAARGKRPRNATAAASSEEGQPFKQKRAGDWPDPDDSACEVVGLPPKRPRLGDDASAAPHAQARLQALARRVRLKEAASRGAPS
jgi:hypothetical protein